MVNSMNKRKNLITPEKAASFLPVIISSFIAILIIIFFVIPKSIKSNIVNLQLNESIRKKDALKDLKKRYKKINQQFDVLNNEKSRIIELISGTSNLDTLLDNLGDIAVKNEIEFLSIVPNKLIISNNSLNNSNNIKNDNSNIIMDPLLVQGLKKYLIDFTFKTNFINLLSFLRELEFQENVILIEDIDIKENENFTEFDNNNLNVKLRMTFYGKI